MPDLNVPWGDGELTLPIPDHWKLLGVATPAVQPSSADWEDRLAQSLHQPIAGASLGDRLATLRDTDSRIALIVEDITRHSPLDRILDIVLREIRHAGIRDDQLEIVIATGMHPPLTPDQAREKLGVAAEQIAWRCNPWDDETQYTRVGSVERLDVQIDKRVVAADLRIIVSSVSPHLQAGFGGGYKMLLPGCAMLQTIRLLHRFGIKRKGQPQLVGTTEEQNRMRFAINRAGELVDAYHGQSFTVQYLLDGENRPIHIAAGDPGPTHQMLMKKCAVACGIVPEEPADILITNAHPRDHDLWQAFKCIPNTSWAARPNGIVICLARCPQGLNEMKTMKWPLSPTWTRRVVRFLGPETICSLLDRLVKQLAGDSQWFIRLATQILQRNPIYMVSETLCAQGASFPGIALFPTPQAAFEAAEAQLGKGNHRVAVYPDGGVTYPILTQSRSGKNGA
jgi:nickel-dependent lactate racemase